MYHLYGACLIKGVSESDMWEVGLKIGRRWEYGLKNMWEVGLVGGGR